MTKERTRVDDSIDIAVLKEMKIRLLELEGRLKQLE